MDVPRRDWGRETLVCIGVSVSIELPVHHLLGQHAERLGGTESSCISLTASNISLANPNESSSAEQEKALEKERDREN